MFYQGPADFRLCTSVRFLFWTSNSILHFCSYISTSSFTSRLLIFTTLRTRQGLILELLTFFAFNATLETKRNWNVWGKGAWSEELRILYDFVLFVCFPAVPISGTPDGSPFLVFFFSPVELSWDMKLHLSILELFLASWPKRWSCSGKACEVRCQVSGAYHRLPVYPSVLPIRWHLFLQGVTHFDLEWSVHISNKSLKNPRRVGPQCSSSPKRITTWQPQAVTQSNSAPYIQRWLQLRKQDFENLKLWKRVVSFVFLCAPTFSNQCLQHKCWPAQDFCPWPRHCHWISGQGGQSLSQVSICKVNLWVAEHRRANQMSCIRFMTSQVQQICPLYSLV